MLDSERRQAIDVLLFWMEAVDDLLTDATATAKGVRQLTKEDASNTEREKACSEYINLMEDVITNLEHLLRMFNAYLTKRVDEILDFEHEID